MSTRKLHRVGDDPSASGEGALDYDTVCASIATALSAPMSSTAPSAAKLVGDLGEQIRAFLDRGGTYRDVARVFEDHGVDASPDAIRVALRRKAGAPGDKAERKVVAGKPAAPKSSSRAEEPLPSAIPGTEEVPLGSDRNLGEEPPAEPTPGYRPREGGGRFVSAPPSSEALHGLRAPSIGKRLD